MYIGIETSGLALRDICEGLGVVGVGLEVRVRAGNEDSLQNVYKLSFLLIVEAVEPPSAKILHCQSGASINY